MAKEQIAKHHVNSCETCTYFVHAKEYGNKETAKEILQQIYNLCKVRNSIQFDDIYYLVNRYGVEVEE